MLPVKQFSTGLTDSPCLVVFNDESRELSFSVSQTRCVADWNFFRKTKLANLTLKIFDFFFFLIVRTSYARSLFMKHGACWVDTILVSWPPPSRSTALTNMQTYPITCRYKRERLQVPLSACKTESPRDSLLKRHSLDLQWRAWKIL